MRLIVPPASSYHYWAENLQLTSGPQPHLRHHGSSEAEECCCPRLSPCARNIHRTDTDSQREPQDLYRSPRSLLCSVAAGLTAHPDLPWAWRFPLGSGVRM